MIVGKWQVIGNNLPQLDGQHEMLQDTLSAPHMLKTDVIFSSPELCSGWAIVITFRPSSIRPLTFSNDFSSEAAEPILLKFHMEPP